jgi:hypothetical protein
MDTLLAMSVAIAEAFYKNIPQPIIDDVWDKLNDPIKKIILEFKNTFCCE